MLAPEAARSWAWLVPVTTAEADYLLPPGPLCVFCPSWKESFSMAIIPSPAQELLTGKAGAALHPPGPPVSGHTAFVR